MRILGEEVKSKIKKYLPYVVGALAIVGVIMLLISVFTGGPKKAVKKYISAFNKRNASKIVEITDFKGSEAWNYYYDVNDFSEDDYEEFIEAYKDIDSEDEKDAKKDAKEDYEDGFDEIDDDYKSYKMKIEKFKSVEEIAKDLYVVKAKISIKAKPDDKDVEEIDSAGIMKFIVYKNKIIYTDF